jgi:hypothetical protein
MRCGGTVWKKFAWEVAGDLRTSSVVARPTTEHAPAEPPIAVMYDASTPSSASFARTHRTAALASRTEGYIHDMRVPKKDPFFGGELSAQPSLVPDPNDFTSGSPQLALPNGGAVGNVPYLHGEGVRIWV